MPDSIFTSVDHYELQKAFAIAHKSASNMNLDRESRKRFRAIAKVIWRAAGGPGAYANRLDPDVEVVLSAIAKHEVSTESGSL